MNDRSPALARWGERGGAHIYVLALLALGTMTVIWMTALNVELQYTEKNSVKPVLDAATHAASLDLDPVQASYGDAVWDSAKGTETFNRYLHLNLHLDSAGEPLPGSLLSSSPVVHYLGFVAEPSYPFDYEYAVSLYPNTPQQTIRIIHTTIYGPSIVAVVEVRRHTLGGGADEPVVMTSVSSVRPRY